MKNAVIAALAFGLFVAAPAARAVEPLDAFSFRIGAYIDTFDTQVRADGTTARGTEIDLHRDLNVDNSSAVGIVGLTWRPWERHEFGFGYFQNDGSATRMITRDLEFQGTDFQTNSTVRTDVSLDAYQFYYTWWAAANERWALGPSVGMTWYRVDITLDMLLDANGNSVNGNVRGEATTDLPALTVGGSWRWVPADDWRLSADVGYFSANIQNLNASVTYGRFGVEWFPWQNSGFSLDYTRRKLSGDVSKTDFNGNIDFVDSGVRLGYIYRW